MKLRKLIIAGVAGALLVSGIMMSNVARKQAHRLITNPAAGRKVPGQTPANAGLRFDEVTITNGEGLKLVAWYLPATNHAVIIAQHGYKMCREEMLTAAGVLNRHGYGVLVTSVRSHDFCDGEQITFGAREINDLEAWCDYLSTRPGVDPQRLGALGNSMGGSLVIQLAAHNPRIKAVVADSPFSSLKDTLSTSVEHFTGLPAFPFAPLVRWWAEVESGCRLSDVDAKVWIKQISPRGVFLMQGGADRTVSKQSGERLYDCAAEPKELWYDASTGHADFAARMPEYERRVVAFFDKHLLSQKPNAP